MTDELKDLEWKKIERAGDVLLRQSDRDSVLAAIQSHQNRSKRQDSKFPTLKEALRRVDAVRKLAEDLLRHVNSTEWVDRIAVGSTLHWHFYVSKQQVRANDVIASLGSHLDLLQNACRGFRELGLQAPKGRRADWWRDQLVENLLNAYDAAGGKFPSRTLAVAAEKDDVDLPVVGFVQAIGRAMDDPVLSLKQKARYRVLRLILPPKLPELLSPRPQSEVPRWVLTPWVQTGEPEPNQGDVPRRKRQSTKSKGLKKEEK